MRKVDVDPVIAVAVSDLHLSHRCPPCRHKEKDWYEAMRRPLAQVTAACCFHNCPALIPGDFFDDGWRMHKCPPELINFAIDYLPPTVYGIPGQHDLPLHNYDDIRKSAYWTLAKMGKIINVIPGSPSYRDNCIIHGFPWGFKVHRNNIPPHTFGIHIAMIHSYIWTEGSSYEGVSESSRLSKWASRLEGYDVALFGDNHKGFLRKKGDLTVVNCGALMIRKTDEADYQPMMSLIHLSGKVRRVPIDMSADRMSKEKKVKKEEVTHDLEHLLKYLKKSSGKIFDFNSAVRRFMRKHDLSDKVKEIIVDSLDKE